MTTQVRIFTVPKSLGETLSAPPSRTKVAPSTSSRQIPRSVPTTNADLLNAIPQAARLPASASGKKEMGLTEDKSYPGVTFAHQEKLAKLPIPDLESSCEKYLQALKPLQSAREHSDTKQAVQDFLVKDGPELQEKLKKYAEGRTSYIEQFCESTCFFFSISRISWQ